MAIPKISVILVSNRKKFDEIFYNNLERQTFRDFEFIVADENIDSYLETKTWFKPRAKLGGDIWNINKAYNDCLDRATGELLVFLQDFIWIPDDGLQRFWDDYQAHPNALITGVGHKAKDGLEGISENDYRVDETKTGLHPCTFAEWEMNWACAPRKIMPRFNEKMDWFYGGENQYVAKLAQLNGAELLVDQSNRCIQYSQEFCGGRPEDWEESHCNKSGRLQSFLRYLDITNGQLE